MRGDDGKAFVIERYDGVASTVLPLGAALTFRTGIGDRELFEMRRVIIGGAVISLSPAYPTVQDELAKRPWITAPLADINVTLPAGAPYAAQRTNFAGHAFGIISRLPTSLLMTLPTARTVTEVSSETIAAIKTRHFAMSIGATGSEASTVSLHVWIDADGFARRLELKRQDWPDSSELPGTTDLFDYGAPLDVSPPPPDQTTDLRVLIGRRSA